MATTIHACPKGANQIEQFEHEDEEASDTKDMDVACSTFSFPEESLEQALRHIVELEFTKVDLGVGSQGPHVRIQELLQDMSAVIGRIRQGPTVGISGVTARLLSTGDDEAREVEAVAHLAKQLSTAIVTVNARPASVGLDAETARLQQLWKICDRQGVCLCVGTTIGSTTELIENARLLCERIPGLGLSLDPSCFISGSQPDGDWDSLFSFARQVVLRDSGRGMDRFQVAVGRGEIDYSKVVVSLAQCQFRGTMVVDFEPQFGSGIEIEAEARKLGRVLESLL